MSAHNRRNKGLPREHFSPTENLATREGAKRQMLERFAERYRVKVCRNQEDETDIIQGRLGHIYKYSATELGAMFIPKLKPGQAPRTAMWNARRAEAEAAGMALRQSGDAEGALSFDPGNSEQARIALEIAKPKRKRQMSPEQLGHLASIGFKARKTTVERLISP
jgi:hypothetical protein